MLSNINSANHTQNTYFLRNGRFKYMFIHTLDPNIVNISKYEVDEGDNQEYECEYFFDGFEEIESGQNHNIRKARFIWEYLVIRQNYVRSNG